MGNGGRNASNPTALRTGGGGRLAGQRSVADAGRLRRQRVPGIQGALDQGRSNRARNVRRAARNAARRATGR